MKKVPAEKLSEVLLNDSRSFIVATLVEVQSRIIDKSPVRTGVLRGSVRVGVNKTNREYGREDPGGDATKQQNTDELNQYELGDDVNISVNAPYAVYVEEGTDTIAPVGMIKTTLEELPAIYRVAEKTMQRFNK